MQYGRRLSHLDWRSWQAKQSSAAPVVGALLRRFRGEVGDLREGASKLWVLASTVVVAMPVAIMEDSCRRQKEWVAASMKDEEGKERQTG